MSWDAQRDDSSSCKLRAPLLALFALVGMTFLAGVDVSGARAQEPGHVNSVSIVLTAATGAGRVDVSLTWQGTANLEADYEVRRLPPRDRSFLEVTKYATVSASERKPDGTFTFVDPDPLSLPDKPCYTVGATVGGVPPSSSSPDVCIPTLPSAMGSLTLIARPGPDAGEWYVDGAGFGPGAAVLVQELTCAFEPCADADLAVATQAASDGHLSTRLTVSGSAVTHTLVAWERGWLPSQLVIAPTVALSSRPGGAGLGYPLTTRTGVPDLDGVLAAIERRDPAAVAALIEPYEITRGDGTQRRGIWQWQCGEVVRSESFEALTGELIGDAQTLYTVYRSSPTPAMPRIFEAADYVAIFAGKAVLVPSSSGSMVGIKDGHIVSIAIHCGDTTPAWFIRDTPKFLIAPWDGGPPLPPTTGSGVAPAGDENLAHLGLAGGLLAVLAALAALKAIRASGRR